MRPATRQTNTVVSQAILGSGTARYSRRTSMPPALTPELALDYLRELSADVRAGVVLAGDGTRLAGPDALAEPARRLPPALPALCSPRCPTPTRPRSRPPTASCSRGVRAATPSYSCAVAWRWGRCTAT